MRKLIDIICGFNACFSDSSIETLILSVKTEPIGCSALVDYAFEMRSDRGVNLHFWVENAVTSAYGRVIGLLTPGGIARSTKQDMEKVEALSTKDVAPVSDDLWATTPVAQTIEAVKNELGGIYLQGKPECKHGARVWRTGTSAKTGKEWGNYSCIEKSKATQCEPVWYMQTSTGWAPQV